MKKRVISFMMSAVLTLSGLGCYGLANVHAETDTNVERKLKIFAHYAEAEKPILDYAISKVQEKYPNVTFEIEAHPNGFFDIALRRRSLRPSVYPARSRTICITCS